MVNINNDNICMMNANIAIKCRYSCCIFCNVSTFVCTLDASDFNDTKYVMRNELLLQSYKRKYKIQEKNFLDVI